VCTPIIVSVLEKAWMFRIGHRNVHVFHHVSLRPLHCKKYVRNVKEGLELSSSFRWDEERVFSVTFPEQKETEVL